MSIAMVDTIVEIQTEEESWILAYYCIKLAVALELEKVVGYLSPVVAVVIVMVPDVIQQRVDER